MQKGEDLHQNNTGLNIPFLWTPENPTNPQNLGIHGATLKRGCAEMEASTIKASKHCGNRCSIPRQTKKTLKSRNRWCNLPKWAARHLNTWPRRIPKKGCKSKNKLQNLQNLQKSHQNTIGTDGAFPWEHLQTQTQKCKNRWRNQLRERAVQGHVL